MVEGEVRGDLMKCVCDYAQNYRDPSKPADSQADEHLCGIHG